MPKLEDLWSHLAQTDKKVVMYGMGNGADKILSVCAERGIEICDFFASDDFVRGHSFRGKRVLSYSEAKEKYGKDNMIVLLSFASSLDDVLENVYRIAEECELYAPDVPVCGTELFDAEFYERNEQKIAHVRSLLADQESKSIYDSIISYKLSGNVAHLRYSYSDFSLVLSDVLGAEKIRCAADLGAYNGDTVREMLAIAPLETAIAAEPDRRNFKKLSAWAEGVEGITVTCHRAAISDTVGLSPFDASGNRNAGLATGRETLLSAVETTTVDLLAGKGPVDYIKYDVEGAEAAALRGSKGVIAREMPRLKVACYHRSEDLFTLPLLLKEIAPDHDIYLVRERSLPLWDLDLLAMPRPKM